MLFNREELSARGKEWQRFNDWEQAWQKSKNKPDCLSLLRWFGEAWELAGELNPQWRRPKIDRDKIQQIQKTRAALARLGELRERSRA